MMCHDCPHRSSIGRANVIVTRDHVRHTQNNIPHPCHNNISLPCKGHKQDIEENKSFGEDVIHFRGNQ